MLWLWEQRPVSRWFNEKTNQGFGGRGRVDRVADSNLRTAAGLRGRGKCRGRTRRWSLAWGCRKGLALATEVYRQKPAGALPARM